MKDTAAEAPKAPTNLFIVVPAYKNILSLNTYLSCMALAPALMQNGIGYLASGASYPEPSEARNILTTIWYDTVPQTSHMLTLDSDMGFNPDLILDMLALDVPLVSTVYRHKADEVTWVGSGLPLEGYLGAATRAGLVKGKFIELEGSGFGITLIRRDCIAAMLEKFPECSDERCATHPAHAHILGPRGIKRVLRLFDPVYHPERGRLSEDISFCTRARAAGIRVMASIGHDTTHHGDKIYSGNFLQYALEHEARAHFPPGTNLQSSMTAGPTPAEKVTP